MAFIIRASLPFLNMQNLLDPAILFFIFGLAAGTLKSNLEIPQQLSRFLSLYLLMALGLKGGFALAESGLTMEVAQTLGAAIMLAVALPAIIMAVVFANSLRSQNASRSAHISTNGTLALLLARLIGISAGNTALLMVLAASASYIAVPAVLRYALPEANPSLYFGMSLGVTFPFNLILGIPLYLTSSPA
jgi:hypothetical protein